MSKSKIQGRAVRENKDGRKKKVGGASALTTMKAFKDWFVIRTKKEGSEVAVEEARQMIQRKEPVILRTIPFPSETDVKMAFYPEVTTIIISLKEENPVVKAFQITEEAIYLNEIDVVE